MMSGGGSEEVVVMSCVVFDGVFPCFRVGEKNDSVMQASVDVCKRLNYYARVLKGVWIITETRPSTMKRNSTR